MNALSGSEAEDRRRWSRWLQRVAFVSLTGWLAPAWSDASPPAAPSSPLGAVEQRRLLDQIETVGRRGFLYEVSRPSIPGSPADGHRLFLYGTIHIGRIGSEPFNLAVVSALGAACRLALEADPTDETAARELTLRLGRYPEGDTLQHHLPAALLARVLAYGERSGLPDAQLTRYRPWLLANILTLQTFGKAGLDPALGSELYLSGYARARRMPIDEIEGIAAQLQLLSGLPDALQVAQLDEALSELDHPTPEDDDEAIFDVWRRGDADAADALVAQMHREAEDRTFGHYFVDTLIDARNRTMADRAERELDRSGPTFFAVGSLHLFGPRGLIAVLRARGHRVADLQDAPARVDQESKVTRPPVACAAR